MKRIMNEEQAMQKYMRNKELTDTFNEERKKKLLKL